MSDPHPFDPIEALALLARWAWVAVPLGWGVWLTVETSRALFR